MDDYYGAEPRRFLRMALDLEIEVLDHTQAAAYTMDWGRDESGKPVTMPYETQNQQMHAAVQQLIATALGQLGSRAGF